MVLEGRSPQQDDVPLLSEEAKAHNRHVNKKRKPRRRSMFQNSDDHHELLASEQDLIGLDIDKVDSWGVLHDTEDDSIPLSSDLRESLEMDPSYIDHRPSIAIMQTATSMHNGAHVGSISSPRRPSTVPRNSASRVSSAEGGKKHPTATNYKFRDPFKSCTVDERLKLRKPYSSKTGQRSSFDRWSTERGYGSVPLYTHSTSRELGIHGSRGDVVIDVDRLMEHVKLQREQGQQESSDAPSEEYNSQPSSRRSSGSSSLDDVCLPIEEGDAEGLKQWPDVSVLEEFSKQEIEKLKREALQDAEDFHFQYDNEEDDDTTESASGIAFLKPIITNIDVPELGNTRVNETEQLRKGRLRPKKITPWHLKKGGINLPGLSTSGKHRPKEWYADMAKEDFLAGCNIQYPPHIISNNPEVFRFTYFREDLDSTIHSPTISGLLQPGQKFDELFVGSVYSSAGGRSSSNNNLTLNANHEAQTPLDTNPSSPAQKASTTHQSGSWDMTNVSPFWLDVLNPTEEEMKVLSKTFGIHPLTTEDIFLGEVREKVELFKDYYLVCFRSFDIVAERSSRKKKKMQQQESVHSGAEESGDGDDVKSGWVSRLKKFRRRSSTIKNPGSNTSSYQRKARRKVQVDEKYKKKSGDRRKPRDGELEPLNVYILVFRTGVLTFHFAPTPHPINVRRRARLLKDYLNVTADWIAYALIDDITDAFAPMIELIEDEVYDIEDSILKMHHSESSSDSSGSDLDGESSEDDTNFPFDRFSRRTTLTHGSRSTTTSRSSSTTDSTINANIMGWKKKGDMLRRIGECRKRVMSIVRLLGSKADVIKGFSKRCNEQWEVALRSEIGMYLGDIQDHIITMVSSLNHYEKLLSRSHSNYLAQINIDMTKVSNDMNDVLGKITILGTIVMPMNIITGLWGMNVIVPGQFNESLLWFFCIALSMVVLAYIAYTYTRKKFGI